MTYVVDASVLVAHAGEERIADSVANRLETIGAPLWAPHLIDAEVGHALRRNVLAGNLTGERAKAALRELARLPLNRVGHRPLLERAWALRNNLSFYDGLYVALAELRDVPLLTLDARVARARGVRARIEVVA